MFVEETTIAVMLSATFDTRREAEMTVARLVQQFELDRAAIFVGSTADENSSGEERAGSDTKAGEPGTEDRSDVPLNGGVAVSVEVSDKETAERAREAFGEFDAAGVVETDPAANAVI